ncbi:hypothetical protein [Anaerococcus jeddahensis]|uniref:hypothetical protein n=1 Tax=Anaerococcus jeddahensis TaxID=1673719 RepID=UPI0006725CC2|nr:hypothetical protein [Anaerococcus jeddahensis]MDU6064494.1 hypothetical protein [Anaerococcus sp.]
MHQIGNTESGEFSYVLALKTVGKNIKDYQKADQLDGSITFVMSGVTNTGVRNYISNPIVMFHKNSITVDIFGNTFFRNYDFSAGYDTGVYCNDEKNYQKMIYYSLVFSRKITVRQIFLWS